MADPSATRIVEVRVGADAEPLLLVDGESVDLAPGDDPERAAMELLADDARQAGRPVSADLILDGGSTQWAVQVHPDGTITDQPDATPPAPQRRRRPVAWLAGAAALAVLAGGSYVAVTTASTPAPDAPAASSVTIPTWAAELPTPAEPARPTATPAPTTQTSAPPLAPALAAAPEPESEPSTRAPTRSVRAPAATEQSAPAPSATAAAPPRPDERPTPAQPESAPAPAVEEEPAAAPSSPGTGSSQRSRSQRPSSSAPATPTLSSSQRGQSGN